MKRLTFLIALVFLCFFSYSQTSLADDLEMFEAGNISTLSIAGHPKANGVDLSIAFPESWVATGKDIPFVAIIRGENISLVIAIVDMTEQYGDLSDEEMESKILTKEYVMDRLSDDIEIFALENTDRFERLTQIAFYYHRLLDETGEYLTTQYVFGHRFIYAGNLIEISLIYNINVSDIDTEDEAATDQMLRPFVKLTLLIYESVIIHGTSKNTF